MGRRAFLLLCSLCQALRGPPRSRLSRLPLPLLANHQRAAAATPRAGRIHGTARWAYGKALEHRGEGNTLVQVQQYEQAIELYAGAVDLLSVYDDAVRELLAAVRLNLSLCFLKLERWAPAVNAASYAMQGERRAHDTNGDVLPPATKAKALFRRATAYEGLRLFDKARDDLLQARVLAPDDASIVQLLRKCDTAAALHAADDDPAAVGGA